MKGFIGKKFQFLLIRVVVPALIDAIYYFVPARKKVLLVIKNDGIGDYLLFRNYLSFLRGSQKFKDFKIYLLTNASCTDLVANWDSKYIDGYFFYGDDYFLTWKLAGLLRSLNQLRPGTIFYPNYSRKHSVDWLIHHIKANNKVGVDGSTVNETLEWKVRADRYYSQLIPAGRDQLHEFRRNRQIVEIFTGEHCGFKGPFVENGFLQLAPNHSVVMFCGASDKKRKWPAASFAQLCTQVIETLKMPVILAGGKDEMETGLEIANGVQPAHFSNQTGLLSLRQLYELIGGARLLISSDTVAVHMAASLQIPIVCISKGDLFGRFVPYPAEVFGKMKIVTPEGFNPDAKSYEEWSPLNIDEVQLPEVFKAVSEVI